ncbi:hypothetical protein CYLTODRAFT_2005 [Cylindrobasidium torrendii FP15055 ss-10]|uniref:BZIP domain-containing protein n=1 Tax=Cylindrobasidium torrendii FP15055 ss-10 TaxID=1314674 RepID=A0A0D7BVN6_9AGAR|nr:hypothetical protein CYLTODRAFT_2005 [Cylindrobasidium torrendii FP15055 ss-10]
MSTFSQPIQDPNQLPPLTMAPPAAQSDPTTQPGASPGRTTRKRKTPPTEPDTTSMEHQPGPPPGVFPPPPHHGMILPPGMPYPPPYDFSPSGMPPPPPGSDGGSGGRALSTSKRAEQNRKAQRAFRERRDQHVKALESRSQLLDAALASADEANRRWEECRSIVENLRMENTQLRVALAAHGVSIPGPPGSGFPPPPTAPPGEEPKDAEGNDKKD